MTGIPLTGVPIEGFRYIEIEPPEYADGRADYMGLAPHVAERLTTPRIHATRKPRLR